MHPTPLDADYMRRVVREADASPYRVDSFEICAMCHSLLGGLDGLSHYVDYPELKLDHAAIDANIRTLREILDIAHKSGRPVYYWHREVTVPSGLVDLIPGLLDAKQEFNLLGTPFEKLLRYKLTQAFTAVSELDGVVLTLTEADYSAIHNSTPEKYPPAEVVSKVAGIFHDELAKRGKRFILRSFGSIAKDYQDILAGARMLSDKGSFFEIETKITPYDFDPFLPENPFLKHTGELTLCAECDSLGEFLGAGNLPAENVDNIVRWVRAARMENVDRFAIRVDRVGNHVFDAYPVNLYAYMWAINDPEASPEDIYTAFAGTHYPEACRAELIALGKQGLEAVLKTHFIRGNVIFHQNPPNASFKYFKAGGFFANFAENVKLEHLSGIWSVLSGQRTGMRREILEEKRQAVILAQDGLSRLEKLRPLLPEKEYCRLTRQWNNLFCAAKSVEAFCMCVAAYFEDMEKGDPKHAVLMKAIAVADRIYSEWNPAESEKVESVNGMEHNPFQLRNKIADIYPGPLRTLSHMLEEEYDAEFAASHDPAFQNAIDLVIPGAVTDEWRCGRYMHACHAILKDGRPCRIVGNPVFPNGTLTLEMAGTSTPSELLLKGYGSISLKINGYSPRPLELNGFQSIPQPESPVFVLEFAHSGSTGFPEIFAVAVMHRSHPKIKS